VALDRVRAFVFDIDGTLVHRTEQSGVITCSSPTGRPAARS